MKNLWILILLLLFSCGKGEQALNKPAFSKEIDSILYANTSVSPVIDSLRASLRKSLPDTATIDKLNQLSEKLKSEASLILSQEALKRSQKLHYAFGIVDSYCKIGIYYKRFYGYNQADSVFKLADSLAIQLNNNAARSMSLSWLAEVQRVKNNYPQAQKQFEEALKFARLSGNLEREAFCISGQGELFRQKAEFNKALQFYTRANDIYVKLNDYDGLSFCFSVMGEIHKVQSNISKAMEFYQRSIEASERTGNKITQAFCLTTIGELYEMQSEKDKAESFFNKSIVLAKENNLQHLLVYNYSALGRIYIDRNEPKPAEEALRKVLRMGNAIENLNTVISGHTQLGNLYIMTGDFEKAKRHGDSVILLSKQINAYGALASGYRIVADVASRKNNHREAINHLLQSLALVSKMEVPIDEIRTLNMLHKEYEATGEVGKAYGAYKEMARLKDSMNNGEQVRKFAAVEYNLKEEKMKADSIKREIEYSRANAKNLEEITQQKAQRNYFIIALVGFALFSFVIYRSLTASKRARKEIEKKNALIESQKMVLEEKQKEIIDSINYAKRIQQAVLPNDKLVSNHLQRLRKKN